jgi:putative transcriptional regulator
MADLARPTVSQWRPVGFLAVAGFLAMAALRTGAGPSSHPVALAQSGSLAGQLLVATEELKDPRFVRSVVYMVHHDANGAMGFIVNRPIGEAPLAELLKRLGMESKGVTGEIRVHFGGPVEPALGFVLHTAEFKIPGTRVVKDGIAMTTQPEIFRAIGTGAGPRRILFALGYAGWAPGQLEGEIKAGAWAIVPADEALVFDQNYEKKWERAMARRTIQL